MEVGAYTTLNLLLCMEGSSKIHQDEGERANCSNKKVKIWTSSF